MFGGYHHVSLDLRQSALYSERDGPKPYLLLLTPLAVVADVPVAITVAIALAEWDAHGGH